MFRPWRDAKVGSKLGASLSSLLREAYNLLHETWLLMTQSRAQKLILAGSILILLAIPVVIVTLGLDLRSIASYGYAGVFVASLISTATIFLPVPGGAVMVIAATIFSPEWVALAAGTGAALGECTAYLAGYGGRVVIGGKHAQRYQKAESWMKRHGSGTIFLCALAPFLPFDLAGIAAGTLRFPFWKFFVATIAGRLIRAFIEVYLIWAIFPSLY